MGTTKSHPKKLPIPTTPKSLVVGGEANGEMGHSTFFLFFFGYSKGVDGGALSCCLCLWARLGHVVV